MEWIKNNMEYFSVIIVAVLGLVGILIKKIKRRTRKQSQTQQNQKQTQKQNVSVIVNNNFEKKEPVITNYVSLKTRINILFIDDEKFENLAVLKNAGWIHVKSIKDIKSIDCSDIQNADVIFVDINGVGLSLFPKDQGLGVAKQIKLKYPAKYVGIYSAQPQKLNSALSSFDFVLDKDADPYEYLNILDNYIRERDV